uniref:Tail protein n=1 Tax=viral metagenome TaxID=1070528 RepID=A0A6M3L1U9_9ZZZZ
MGWTAPRDWTVGETVTEDMMDEQVKGNMRYLKGLDGVPTIESGLIIDNTGGDEYLKLPLLTTAEAGTVLAAEGKVAFDEQTHQVKIHNGTAVKAVISEADVDDTPVNGADTVPVSSNWAYDFQQTLTTGGDLPYATAAGVWDRLAKGTAGQRLSMNAGETAPEWQTVNGIAINTGSYTGDDSVNRAIAHGLGTTPSYLAILTPPSGSRAIGFWVAGFTYFVSVTVPGVGGAVLSPTSLTVTANDATNFYVGNATDYYQSMNANLVPYNWVALG